jgi:hypothetical protein
MPHGAAGLLLTMAAGVCSPPVLAPRRLSQHLYVRTGCSTAACILTRGHLHARHSLTQLARLTDFPFRRAGGRSRQADRQPEVRRAQTVTIVLFAAQTRAWSALSQPIEHAVSDEMLEECGGESQAQSCRNVFVHVCTRQHALPGISHQTDLTLRVAFHSNRNKKYITKRQTFKQNKLRGP